VNPSLEDQLRAFAARNLAADREDPATPAGGLPRYPASSPEHSRTGLLVAGCAAIALLVIAGLAVWRASENQPPDVVATQPAAVADPTQVIATRAAAADTKFFIGSWPEHAASVMTTVGQMGDRVARGACDPNTPVLLVEFTWDEPITLKSFPGTETTATSTDRVQYARVGDPDGGGDRGGCENSYGTFGIIQDQVDLTAMGTPAEVEVGDHLLVVASAHALDRASLLKRLPTTVQAFQTTPDQLSALMVTPSWKPECVPSQIIVFQMTYADAPGSYLGEGPNGAVNVPIGSTLDIDALPIDAPKNAACNGGGSMSETATDLTPLGTPVSLDIYR
jgi:hypothetical protein